MSGRGRSPSVGGRHRKKGDLPSKVCATCGRPFTWRRKWAKVWDQVKYCSDRCRGARPAASDSRRAGEE